MNVQSYIHTTHIYDLPIWGSRSHTNGWKLSLQGKTVEDSTQLYNLLEDFLTKNSISFKVGTKKRIDHTHPEQSKKVMTIYCPNDMHIKDLAEQVYTLTMHYKGWYDVKCPTSYKHYAGCVYYRNDRDEYNNYIKAN